MTNEIYRTLLKGLTKAWLQNEMDRDSDPQEFANRMFEGLTRYVGTCPVKLLSFLEILGEATEELKAEKLGLATPNVKPEAHPVREDERLDGAILGGTARHRNWD